LIINPCIIDAASRAQVVRSVDLADLRRKSTAWCRFEATKH